MCPQTLQILMTLQVWKCPKGAFERNIQGHNSIVNGLDLVCESGQAFAIFFLDASALQQEAVLKSRIGRILEL